MLFRGPGTQLLPAQGLLGVHAELTVDIPSPQLHDAVGEGGGGWRAIIWRQSGAITVSARGTPPTPYSTSHPSPPPHPRLAWTHPEKFTE